MSNMLMVRSETRKDSEYQSPNLPEELIERILMRLPVRTLMKFTRVSKSWLSLINRPDFARYHLDFSSATRRMLLLSEYKNITRTRCIHSYSLPPKINPYIRTLDVTEYIKELLADDPLINIVGSCNGLVCIDVDAHIVIWNPSTKKSWIFPGTDNLGSYGFGYDVCNNVYKVVRTIFFKNRHVDRYEHDVQICNVGGANLWRPVLCVLDILDKDFVATSGGFLGVNSVFLNGAIHWIASFEDDNVGVRLLIVAMNLTTETFAVIPSPNHRALPGIVTMLLGVSDEDHLCVAYNYEIHMDVWKLKTYGVQESWTRKLRIRNWSNGYGNYKFGAVLGKMNSCKRRVELLVSENGGVAKKFERGLWKVYPYLKGVMEFSKFRCNVETYGKILSFGSDHYIKFGCTTYFETLISV